MRIGYNTNGFAHHRFITTLALLAEIGYESVAITLDHHVLNPYEASDLPRRLAKTQKLLDGFRMRSVIETGARFLLDSRRKHEPTLMSHSSEERQRRIDFLCRAVNIAAELGSDAVSFWSGELHDDIPRRDALDRLVDGCCEVLVHAEKKDVALAFEPEPGMFIARMSEYAELARFIDHPLFGLTIDVGHVHCLDDGPIPKVLERWRRRLFNIHIEDMRRGVHDHLPFGEGEIEFAPVLATLDDAGYSGGVHVELSRHSHDAVNVARRAYEFLRSLDPTRQNQ